MNTSKSRNSQHVWVLVTLLASVVNLTWAESRGLDLDEQLPTRHIGIEDSQGPSSSQKDGSNSEFPFDWLEAYPGSVAAPELQARMAKLAAVGAAEVEAALKSRGATNDFSERLAVALDLGKARIEDVSEPGDLGPDTYRILDLMAAAESYSEAKLLVHAVYRGDAKELSVPAELSEDPNDSDWEFEGYSKALPEVIADALLIRRESRNLVLDQLTDEGFDRYATAVEGSYRQQRAEMAAVVGRFLDDREDLYVAVLNDGQIWRRKKPLGYVPSDVERQEPGGTDGDSQPFPELEQSKGIIGSDNRELRSEYNGYDMQSSVWKPKGAIINESDSTNGDPIDVSCTGVKIGERLVVTAGHCLFKNGSWNSNRRWIPGADGIAHKMGTRSDPSPNGSKSSYTRLVRGPWHDHEWGNYDFGLFVLYDNNSSCRLPWHGWWKTSLLHKTVYLYGYPGERQNCAASPLSSDDCYSSIYGAGGTISYAGSYRVRYSIDTQSGQSGTGFYRISSGSRYVVGVHRGKYNSSKNYGIRINSGNRNMINDARSDYPPNACP